MSESRAVDVSQAAANRRLPPLAYFDASLRGETGHQANACRQIAGELRRRGNRVDVFASRLIGRELAAELDAELCFRLLPYEQSKIFGAIDAAVQEVAFGQDLRQAWARGRYPLVYFNSVLAPQFAAIGKWLSGFSADAAPRVAIEFGAPSGASSGGWFAQFADQYRSAACNYRSLGQERLLLFSFDAAASVEYAQLLQLPVDVLPTVHRTSGPVRRRRRGPRGLTLGFLGQQRAEKGVNLLPDLILALLRADPTLRVLVHDGDATERPIAAVIRRLAKQEPRVEYLQRPADPVLWRDLLMRTDLMVLPYDPARYKASYSAVAVEAVSAGIPLVVPSGTTLERMALEYQKSTCSFDTWDANSISVAVERALREFDDMAAKAQVGAEAWNRRNGAPAFVDRLLDFAAPALEAAEDAVPVHPGVSRLGVRALDAMLAMRAAGKWAVNSVIGTERHAP